MKLSDTLDATGATGGMPKHDLNLLPKASPAAELSASVELFCKACDAVKPLGWSARCKTIHSAAPPATVRWTEDPLAEGAATSHSWTTRYELGTELTSHTPFSER